MIETHSEGACLPREGQSPQKIVVFGATADSLLRFRLELFKQLTSQGLDVYALAPDLSEGIAEQLRSLGVQPISVTLNRGGLSIFRDLSSLIELWRTFRRLGPDIVLSYFAKPIVFGTLAAYLARVPRRFVLLEGLGYFFTKRPDQDPIKVRFVKAIMVSLYWLSLPLATCIFTLNPDDPKDLIQRYRIPVRKIKRLGPIGLDLKRYPYSPAPTAPNVTFLFMGRLLREKGIHEFLSAAQKVREAYSESRFVVVGGLDFENPGALSEEVITPFVSGGIIEYQGHIPDPAGSIAKCSVFVLPSYREGFPRSTQEAMAVGRAIITTDVPGCRETVHDGVNGFLVPPFHPEALAEKMTYFMENREAIQRMGQESHNRAIAEFDEVQNTARLVSWLLPPS